MDIITILAYAVGLSMDAFAVSVCKGLAMRKILLKNALIVGIWFGSFQAAMPLFGYLLGSRFRNYIEALDHWVAFALLLLIGLNMLREALTACEECEKDAATASVKARDMVVPAFATSIDALVVGIAMAMSEGNGHGMNIFAGVGIIGAVTLLLCAAGVKIGGMFGEKYKKSAEIAGGIILILIGVKTVLEHTGVIGI
ncbi:MAG: manganese efflux pump MntP family protein [Ruminococcaceae bacterium]|nr:manganese efflux pump MntP family protein [Oscillospiraceae bacterium]